jgi:hypothetical protein
MIQSFIAACALAIMLMICLAPMPTNGRALNCSFKIFNQDGLGSGIMVCPNPIQFRGMSLVNRWPRFACPRHPSVRWWVL